MTDTDRFRSALAAVAALALLACAELLLLGLSGQVDLQPQGDSADKRTGAIAMAAVLVGPLS